MSTLDRLQYLEDSDRKQHWFHIIQNEVLYPLVKIYVHDLTLTSFTPDPTVVEALSQKDFDHFSVDHEQIIRHSMTMFYGPALGHEVALPLLEKFLRTVGNNYLDNPFHNFRHAYSVIQILYSMSALTEQFSLHLKPLEYFTLLVAAIGHDLDHRKLHSAGFTNAFLVNSRHCLSKRYNDTSVLENHHTATLLKILDTEDTSLLGGFSPEVKAK
jgi:high affinity cGMP-specific 3',5'-cyclic phosphodiesterase 9